MAWSLLSAIGIAYLATGMLYGAWVLVRIPRRARKLLRQADEIERQVPIVDDPAWAADLRALVKEMRAAAQDADHTRGWHTSPKRTVLHCLRLYAAAGVRWPSLVLGDLFPPKT